MAVNTCILAKAAEGLVSKSKAAALAEEVTEAIDRMVADGTVKGPAAERLAAERILKDKRRTQIRKKRMDAYQTRISDSIQADAKVAEETGIGVDTAMQARYSPDLSRRMLDVDDVESRTNAIKGRIHGKLGEVFERFRPRLAGLKQFNMGEMDDVIHHVFGKHGKKVTNPIARSMGDALMEAMEYARLRYNAAGGDIPKREDWGFFQTHDPTEMASVSKAEWVRFVKDRIALERMFNEDGAPISAKALNRQLDELYENTVSRGLKDLPGKDRGPGVGGSNVNVRANARFLVFKDSSAWLEYHNKFGGKTGVYDHVINSIERMARDTALLEVLGPYPEATLRLQENLIDAAEARGAISQVGKAGRKSATKIGAPKTQLNALYRTVTGRSGITANESFSLWSNSVRGVLTSAALGGAFLSAIADLATTGLTARMTGVAPMKVWGRTLKMFAVNQTADRRLAVNLGFAAQGWASRAIAAQRVLGENVGHGWVERMTDVSLRASLLSPWTEAGRFSFQVEMLSFITAQAGKNFDDLNPALLRTFKEHGLTEEMWETIRKTDQWEDPAGSGAKFLRAEDVQGTDLEGPKFDAANKLQQVIIREMEYAIPGANARVRSVFTQGQPGGTMWGEIMRNTAMFKSFPISIQAMHWRRLAATSGLGNKTEYALWLFAGMTAMGAIGTQLTDISRGRDPQAIDNPKFWRDAMIRGGSGGLMGDLLLQEGRYGGNMDTLLGPVWSLGLKGFDLSIGNLKQALDGDDTDMGREFSRFVEQNMPGRSTWYARLAFERMLFDNLDRLLDPEAEKEFAKVEKKRREERRQDYFARPGRGIQRLPDLTKMLQ
jgi:hypothetical protein